MLPIYQLEPDLRDALAPYNRLVIEAPTGSGKSTELPQMLLDTAGAQGQILMLQPLFMFVLLCLVDAPVVLRPFSIRYFTHRRVLLKPSKVEHRLSLTAITSIGRPAIMCRIRINCSQRLFLLFH